MGHHADHRIAALGLRHQVPAQCRDAGEAGDEAQRRAIGGHSIRGQAQRLGFGQQVGLC
jgi:hypothetical protein